MSILTGHNCIHFLDYNVTREDKDKMSVIKSVTVQKVRINDLVEHVYSKLDTRNNLRDPVVKTTFDALPELAKKKLATSMFIYRYCIHRILTHFKLFTPEVWKYYATDDYYSQEVNNVFVERNRATIIDRVLNEMRELPDNKKIELMLQLEYGKVLPTIKDKVWRIATITKDDLLFSNESHLKKCIDTDKSYLDSYKLPRGLCVLMANGKYRVIDGYHRLCNIVTALIIYCEDESINN